jgi:hypothetical protein
MSDDTKYVIEREPLRRLILALREAKNPRVPFQRDNGKMLQSAFEARGEAIVKALNVCMAQPWWSELENQTRPET